MKINRRSFIKSTAAATAGSWLMPKESTGKTLKPTIYVVHGEDPGKMLAAGIEKYGGWGALVKKGGKVTLKPNVAWASRPEQGGNTNPVLVGACVTACKAAGAGRVVVPENTCSDADKSFSMSGVQAAVKKAGGEIYSLEKGDQFRKVLVPRGKNLQAVDVAIDVLDTDLLINMPVAKSHGGCTITASMKNWMGSVQERKIWHLKGVDQCVADFSTFLIPDLIIVDATRMMTTEGPGGPGIMAYPKELVFGKDPVAVDAYVATLFKLAPFDVAHIRIAHDMKIGMGDLKKVDIVQIKTV